MLPGRTDAEMGPADSEYNERLDLLRFLFKIFGISLKKSLLINYCRIQYIKQKSQKHDYTAVVFKIMIMGIGALSFLKYTT